MDKLITSYTDLDVGATLARLKAHQTAMTGNAKYPAPVPTAADLDALITDLEAKIATQATAQENLDTANTELDDAVLEGQRILGQRATNCNSVTPGDTAALQSTALLLAAPRTPAGPTPRVQNVRLTVGDSVGTIDVAWNSLLRKASSYQLQSATNLAGDPNTATWTNHDPVTKSSTTLGPFTSGTRLWIRARAIGTNGPGDWSDPATIIVP